MDENQNKQTNLIDTTDCLEAVAVFRGWKNFLFVITILCFILLQTSFWLVNTGCVKTENGAKSSPPVVADDKEQINKAAKEVVANPNQPEKTASQEASTAVNVTAQQPEKQQADSGFGIKFKHLAWLIRFLNFVLIPTSAFYCLTMLFILKVSMLGRLGGINHISRAFFLSLAMLVLLLPWQRFFGGVVVGAMYTPKELLSSCTAVDDNDVFGTILHYLRFTGYWLLVLLLLIFSQVRSGRWAKAILRRLEVV